MTRKEGTTPARASNKGRLVIAAAMLFVTCLIGYRLNDRLSQLDVDREVFPVEAFQYMSDEKVGGRLVVTYDWAQYAIAAACVETNLSEGQPPSSLAFDGRFRTCYPQQVVDMHFDFLFGEGPHVERYRSPDSPPCDPTRVLRHGDPELVLIRRKGERTCKVMEGCQEDWVLLYQDGLAELWGGRDKYDNPESETYIPVSSRKIGNTVHMGYVSWPALPIKNRVVVPANQLTNSMPVEAN